MVKLEYRPYLIALLGLTVCISVWEIAVVQRGNNLPESLISERHQYPNYVTDYISHKNASHDKERADKTGNREILSSGQLLNPLEVSGPEEIPLNSLEGADYKRLIGVDFEFLINQPPCPKAATDSPHGGLLVLVLVHSAPKNFQKRLTIRQTWGSHPDPGMKLYFLLGNVPSSALQLKLEMENDRFGDLIQGSFLDTYRNMTYKHTMALKWFSYHCPGTPLMLKTDDDVFVNTPALMEYARENVNGVRDRRNLVNCKVISGATVKRSYRSKWRVSVREYPRKVYPEYCPGFIVLYSADMAVRLYRAAQVTKYFWIDDVHVTGTLREKLNGTLTPFRDTYFKKGQRKRLREPYVRNMPLFSEPDLTEPEIRTMWAMVGGRGSSREGFREDAEIVALLATNNEAVAGSAIAFAAGKWRLEVVVAVLLLLAVVQERIKELE